MFKNLIGVYLSVAVSGQEWPSVCLSSSLSLWGMTGVFRTPGHVLPIPPYYISIISLCTIKSSHHNVNTTSSTPSLQPYITSYELLSWQIAFVPIIGWRSLSSSWTLPSSKHPFSGLNTTLDCGHNPRESLASYFAEFANLTKLTLEGTFPTQQSNKHSHYSGSCSLVARILLSREWRKCASLLLGEISDTCHPLASLGCNFY